YVVVDDLATLLWLGNLDCLELHPWLSPAASPDFPDFAVFDLDPAPPAGFEEARQLAFDVRRLLERWALRGYPKLSGATGVHVYVPLLPRYSYAVVRQFVLGTAQLLLRLRPERVTLERRVHRRAGRVYLDYLQNVRGKTIVAAYSPRPLPGAPVSLPVTWRELERVQPDEATLLTVPARLAGRGDPFAQVLTDRQSIDEALRSLGGGCS
ncbi:MAG: hypothetical protein IRY95_10730, partial [Clostridia bacterium]|nr:hypothetical protein [Clostridia bacterium]